MTDREYYLEDQLDHHAYDFATKKLGGWGDPESFAAWEAFYKQEGEGWDSVSYHGTFDDDIEFTKEQVANLADIPDWVVVDYNATSNIVSDYVEVDLPDGRKGYFR